MRRRCSRNVWKNQACAFPLVLTRASFLWVDIYNYSRHSFFQMSCQFKNCRPYVRPPLCLFVSNSGIQGPGGGGTRCTYRRCISMCGPMDMFLNRFGQKWGINFGQFGLNRVWFLHSTPELSMFLRRSYPPWNRRFLSLLSGVRMFRNW